MRDRRFFSFYAGAGSFYYYYIINKKSRFVNEIRRRKAALAKEKVVLFRQDGPQIPHGRAF